MHAEYMKAAIAQAKLALEAGEVPVGAVVVKDGRVIAAAHNLVESSRDASAHAEMLGYTQPLYATAWPTWDENALVKNSIEYGVQVNGKIRARIELPADMAKEEVEAAAKAHADVVPFLEGKTVRKVIVVKNIVNIVVG